MNINDLPPEILSNIVNQRLNASDLWTLARRLTREGMPLSRAAQENAAWMKFSPDALVDQVLTARDTGQPEPSLLLAFEGRLKNSTRETKTYLENQVLIDLWEADSLSEAERSHFDLVLSAALSGADTTSWMGRDLFVEPQIISTILRNHTSLANPLMPPEMLIVSEAQRRPDVEVLNLFKDNEF